MAKKRYRYTPELLKKIEHLASVGYTQRQIEGLLGLPTDAIGKEKYIAKKRGYTQINQAFIHAREKFIQFHLKNINEQAKKDWRAAKYLLSITHPEVFLER